MEFVFMAVVVLVISVIIVIPIFITSSAKTKNKKNEALNRYKAFISQNGMKNYQTVSYDDIVEIDIDNKQKLLGAYSYYESESSVLKFSEILDFEIIENGNSVVSSRTGSAVVGGLLFGGIGAVAGASGSRNINDECTMLKLKIYTNDVSHSVVTLDFLDNSISKSSNLYEELTEKINEMISLLKIAREDNKQTKNDMKQDNNLSSLKELAELKEKGIITEKEFEESKKKILEKL